MRDYKAKMDQYRLSDDLYNSLRELCRNYEQLSQRDKRAVDDAFLEMRGSGEDVDILATWVYWHVTSDRYTWPYMEARGIPCTQDTFRVYRAKFFWLLAQRM